MMRAHKQHVTIVRKSESSVKIWFRSTRRKKINRISMSDETMTWQRYKRLDSSYLWKSAGQKRTAKYIERFHRLRWWCLQYLNWTDSKSNWRPYWSIFYLIFLFKLNENDFTIDFTSKNELRRLEDEEERKKFISLLN